MQTSSPTGDAPVAPQLARSMSTEVIAPGYRELTQEEREVAIEEADGMDEDSEVAVPMCRWFRVRTSHMLCISAA